MTAGKTFYGTKSEPIYMSPNGWRQLSEFIRSLTRHIHVLDRGGNRETCVKNRYGALCR